MKDWIKSAGAGLIAGLIAGLLGGILCLTILTKSYNNPEVFGTVADWFGGLITSIGILVSLWWNYKNSRTKLYINLTDIHFKINHKVYSSGRLIFRVYNSSNRPMLIDEIGVCIKLINDNRTKKKFVPLYQKQDFADEKLRYPVSIKPYSDYQRRFLISDLNKDITFYTYNDQDNKKITTVTVIPYSKNAKGKYLFGNKKIKINRDDKTINGNKYDDEKEIEI